MWEFITESVMFKTSTSHSCQTEGKHFWQLYNEFDNSTEHLNNLKHIFHEIEPSTESSSRNKTCIN